MVATVSQIREILAEYDDTTISVYQAFNSKIAVPAINTNHFSDGFSFERRSWIKPNFGWMLYRSGYGSKPNQEYILKIKIKRSGFDKILLNASLNENNNRSLKNDSVICQWDPFRDFYIKKVPSRRAIQLGLKGDILHSYVNEWIVDVIDVSNLAYEIKSSIDNNTPLPDVPLEIPYPVSSQIITNLGM